MNVDKVAFTGSTEVCGSFFEINMTVRAYLSIQRPLSSSQSSEFSSAITEVRKEQRFCKPVPKLRIVFLNSLETPSLPAI